MSRILIVSVLIILCVGLFSSSGLLAAPPAVPTPKPVSSGGSSGGGSYVPPAFEPYTIDLKSTDGSVIGSVVGKDFYSATLAAKSDNTVNNRTYSVAMDAELTAKPADDSRLDMTFYAPGNSGLPKGMDDVRVLGLLSIRKSGTPLSAKADSIKLTIAVPGLPSNDTSAVYYLVNFDGAAYRIQNITLQKSEFEKMTFVVSPGADSGLFTLVEAAAVPAIPSPTAIVNLSNIVQDTSSEKSLALPEIGLTQFFAILGAAIIVFSLMLFVVYRVTKL